MLPPLPLPGIALAGRMLLSKYRSTSPSAKKKQNYRLRPRTKPVSVKREPTKNPLQTLFGGLTTTLSQITKKNPGEDYSAVVRGFIPKNATLLAPRLPAKSQAIQFADLDGDSRNELITSYKSSDGVKTLVLKKDRGSWRKVTEIHHTQHDTLHYRNFIDITGEGKQQMLMGMTSEGRTSTLYGYSLENNGAHQLFARNYQRFEVLNTSQSRNTAAKAQLAVWNQRDLGAHDIEVLQWNGLQLENMENSSTYYSKSVVPYYMSRVKKSPHNSSHWYNLADALIKAGAHKDAQVAIDVGMAQSEEASFKEKFIALKNKIS